MNAAPPKSKTEKISMHRNTPMPSRRPFATCSRRAWCLQIIACVIALTFWPGGQALARDEAPRVLTLVVPFPPGGRSDVAARLIAPRLAKSLGAQISVVNRPGAGSAVGSRLVAHSNPQEGLLLFTSSALVAGQYLTAGAPRLSDFKPIGLVARAVPLLAVNPAASRIRSIAQLRAHAGTTVLQLGVNAGGSSQVVSERFLESMGIRAYRVAFKGDADALTALAGGHIDAYLAPFASLRPFLETGRIETLAVASEAREPGLPDTATFRELEVDFVIDTFEGLFAPASIPSERLDQLRAGLREVMQSRELRNALADAGLQPLYRASPAAELYLKSHDEAFSEILSRLGLALPGSVRKEGSR